MKTAQVHRFYDKVAAYLGNGGETVYLTPREARKIANALRECARSIDTTGFLQSKFETVEVKINGER